MSVSQGRDHCAAVSGCGGSVVRIGAVRVRLSPVAQSGGSGPDCCCGVPVPWPSRSRIPLPAAATAAAAAANNRRGIFSRGPAPVYRSSVEWRQRAPNVVTSCFGRDKASPEDPGDTQRLIGGGEDDTLDRLSKFRFGGGDRGRGTKRTPPHKKKPRSSDKTERLRELTEKLKSPPAGRADAGPSTASVKVTSAVTSGGASGGSAVKSAPSTPVSQPDPGAPCVPVSQEVPAPAEDDLFECVNLSLPKPESRTIVGSYIQRTIPFRSASFSQVDFSPVDGKYIRSCRGSSVSSKIPSLGTSSVCLTLPRKKPPEASPSSTSLATTTTTLDVSESSNPSLDSAVGSSEWIFPKVSPKPVPTEPHAKPPHLRSLTHPLTRRGSSTEETIPYSSIDGNGLKSLGLPGLREESDTDSAAPSEPETLSVTTSQGHDEEPTNAQEGGVYSDKELRNLVEEKEKSVSFSDLDKPDVLTNTDSSLTATNVDVVNNNDVKDDLRITLPKQLDTITECHSLHEYKIDNDSVSLGDDKCIADSKEKLSESNQSSIETFVAKWPDENAPSPGEVKCIHTDYSHLKEVELPSQVSNDGSITSNTCNLGEVGNSDVPKQSYVECTTITPKLAEDKVLEDTTKRWSDDGTSEDNRTSNEWPSSPQEEPQTPEDSSARPNWSRVSDRRWLERPRLVCQSSEERDDDSVTRGSPKRYHPLGRNDSLSEGESDTGERRPTTPSRERDGTASPSMFGPSDQSDSESRFGSNVNVARSPHTTRRYSKRPLRGPYGQMLEAEMKKPEANRKFSKLQYNDELKFLENYAQPPTSPNKSSSSRARAVDDCHLKRSYTSPESPLLSSLPRNSPKRKVSANIPYSAPNPPTSTSEDLPVVHIRTTSSPSQLEGCATATSTSKQNTRPPQPSPQLLAQLLKGSSERIFVPESPSPPNHTIPLHHWKDTRTHVVVELYETERSYVESLQILVTKYLQPLKSPENAGLVDAALVDEIFYQVPAILAHHEEFLEELKNRLEHWDVKQRVGDIFLETFTKHAVIDTYTAFINNWKTAKEAIKTTCQAKPAFARFLEAMAREHKGKLALDSLLIMPVQRIPRYELLIQTLLKHTEASHPDHGPLCEAQREVHALAVRINCTERESLELEQLEALIESTGGLHLVAPDRSFLRHDLVTMSAGQGRKERALFLFSDLLVVTSIKRRSGTIRKPSTNCPGTIASTLEANKYKLLMRIPLDDLEIVKEKDENVRRMLREMEHLREDVQALGQMCELVASLHCPHSQLESDVRDMHSALSRQLTERQNTDSQLSYLELMLNTQNGVDNLSVIFSKPDKRSSWEETFNEAKQRLALSADKRLSPEFVAPVPIRKTRAGLQFTCAAPTLGPATQDVWVCNSDGYVGQVCVLSLSPEPTVTSCNGVCNARILCIAAIPAATNHHNHNRGNRHPPSTNSNISISVEDTEKVNMHLESSSSSDDEEGEVESRRSREVEGGDVGVGGEGGEDCDHLQPTMWLGTEDGCIHVYNSSDNIRIKKNKIKIQHGSSVHSIIYLDNRVFVSLANGDISVYMRDSNGVWNTSQPYTVTVGSVANPVTRMVPISGKLWCSCHNTIKVLNISNLSVEHQFSGSGETQRSISCLAVSGLGVWLSLQHSAVIRLFHAASYDCLGEVNIAPAVTKMLASCDDIIRQHKAACLRVTSLLASQDLLWVGTSAGVILTMPLPHVSATTTKLSQALQVTGRSKCVPHGHTGHVRFLTAVESKSLRGDRERFSHSKESTAHPRVLVISGGDGYEDFRSAGVSEVAGREDSTNHLLLWQT
ncbi:rho guanine nucleotide exchange factor 17-like isoform X2 [Homalodisca vitripennis]|uniref:rho guanine nucleotide exchange factor 17-like isoform X2 n=1 Tax=Homalodisca vitripennis TaxID=197043 RepID=UPI001EEA5537|nr:rho guanine nucleotide exchange factor 17-like isoform X2 [Homalodisca vitripennis]